MKFIVELGENDFNKLKQIVNNKIIYKDKYIFVYDFKKMKECVIGISVALIWIPFKILAIFLEFLEEKFIYRTTYKIKKPFVLVKRKRNLNCEE